MDWAAENGHIAVVKWLHLNRTEGCITDATTFAMAKAAENDHPEIVKYVQSHCR